MSEWMKWHEIERNCMACNEIKMIWNQIHDSNVIEWKMRWKLKWNAMNTKCNYMKVDDMIWHAMKCMNETKWNENGMK